MNCWHCNGMQLKGLKSKSLIQELIDGGNARIGVHDLWIDFARLEVREGEFGSRRWMHEGCKGNMLEDIGSPGGLCWVNMKRMSFFGDVGVRCIKGINIGDFSNIVALKLDFSDVKVDGLVLDVRKLKHLRSFELIMDRECEYMVEVVGISSVVNL